MAATPDEAELDDSDSAPDQLELAVLATLPELREVLDGIDEVYWPPIVGKFLHRAIGEARDYAALVRELRATMPVSHGGRSTVTSNTESSAAPGRASRLSDADDDESDPRLPLSSHVLRPAVVGAVMGL